MAVVRPADAYGAEVVMGGLNGAVPMRPVVLVTYQPGLQDFKEVFSRLGGVDVEALQREVDVDQKKLRHGLLRLFREAFQQAPAGEKPNMVVTIPLVEGRRVWQEAFDQEVLRGVREAFIKERGWSVEFLKSSRARTVEAALQEALARSTGDVAVAVAVREHNWESATAWLEAARLVIWPLPSVRVAPVLVEVEVTVMRRGSLEGETPSRWKMVMSLLPKYRANPLRLDAVYAPGDWGEGLQQLAQLKFHELDLPVVGSQRWHRDEFLRHVSRSRQEVWVPTVFAVESGEDRMQAFIRLFETHYAETPDRYAALGYDAAGLALQLLRERRGGPSQWRVEYRGATGATRVEGGRVTRREFLMLTPQEGQWIEWRAP